MGVVVSFQFDGEKESCYMRVMLSQHHPMLARYLNDRGAAVSWLSRAEDIRAVGTSEVGTAYEYGGHRAKVSPRSVAELRRAILAEKPDLVHAFLGRPLAHLILATAGMRNRPRIVSFRGITAKPTYGDPANWISYLHPRVDAQACESEAVRAALVAGGIPSHRCATVYNYVSPTPPSPTQLSCEDFGFPKHSFVIGTVATVRRVKGIDVLLQAMRHLSDLKDLRLLIVGPVKDPRVKRLLKHPELEGRIHATGFRGDAPSLMKLMDLFVMPSRAEALCRAVLEAMSLRRCMLVSDAGGLKEAIRHEIDGVVVQRENPVALAVAIRDLYASPNQRRRYSESAEMRAHEFFSPLQWNRRVTELYEQTLASNVLSRSQTAARERNAA